jgi:hypothetical protein
MSDERTYYESIRRRANRAQERLAATLEQARSATTRDKRTGERRKVRNSPKTRLGGERNGTRFGKRTRQLGEDREVGVQPDPLKATDTERQQRPLML